MDSTNEIMMNQVVIAAIATKVIEYVKRSSRFQFLSQNTATWNRALSILISMATAGGLTWSWTGTWEEGRTLTVAIPPLQAVQKFILHACFQFISQESLYQGLVRPPRTDEITAIGTVTTPGTNHQIGDIAIQGVSIQANAPDLTKSDSPKVEGE